MFFFFFLPKHPAKNKNKKENKQTLHGVDFQFIFRFLDVNTLETALAIPRQSKSVASHSIMSQPSVVLCRSTQACLSACFPSNKQLSD